MTNGDPLEDYPFDDILSNYILLAEDFGWDDFAVVEFREELLRRGCLIVREEPEEPDQGEVGQPYHTYYNVHTRKWHTICTHESLSDAERNA